MIRRAAFDLNELDLRRGRYRALIRTTRDITPPLEFVEDLARGEAVIAFDDGDPGHPAEFPAFVAWTDKGHFGDIGEVELLWEHRVHGALVPREVHVDYSNIGFSDRFVHPIRKGELGEIAIGDLVLVLGDTVPPRWARVEVIHDDVGFVGVYELEFISPLR